MKKFLAILFLFAAIHGKSFAVLPPLWQGVQELKAILTDKHLEDFLDSADIISSIKKVDEGWIIITNRKRVTVKITYDYSGKPGPVQFRINFLEG